METIGTLLYFAGLIVAAIGGIWFLVVAFQESVLWGLGCMFVPLVALAFLIMHWSDARNPFFLQLAAAVPMIAGLLMTS